MKYCLMSLSAANRDGRKSIKDETWPPCPKKKPEAGAIYAGPGFSHSLAGGRGSVVCGGESVKDVASLCPVMKVSDMVNSSYCAMLIEARLLDKRKGLRSRIEHKLIGKGLDIHLQPVAYSRSLDR